jgi:hypothetical protein
MSERTTSGPDPAAMLRADRRAETTLLAKGALAVAVAVVLGLMRAWWWV